MHSTRVSQLIRAPAPAVYRTILDADAYARWCAPDDMTCVVHEYDATVGGRLRISLSYDDASREGKSAPGVDTFHGRFIELVPDSKIVEQLRFETGDATLGSLMTMTVTLHAVDGGTQVEMLHEGLSDAVPAADNVTGTRMALAKLAQLVEAGPG